MNVQELSRTVDSLATRDPERCGYGYADSQHAWHHDPAFDHPRTALLEFLQFVGSAPRQTAVLVGLGRRGTMHRALRLVAARVISIEPDRARIDALLAQGDLDPARDRVIAEDAATARAQDSLHELEPAADVLLLDLDRGPEATRAAWQRLAPGVSTGGIVAIVDRSQVHPGVDGLAGIDEFVADLAADFLLPRGVRLQRFGDAHAIFAYTQTASCRTADAERPWPAERARDPRPMGVGERAGFHLHRWQQRCLAVRGGTAELCPRALLRNDYEVVLVATDAAGAAAAAETWVATGPVLDAARTALAQNDLPLAHRLVAGIVAAFPTLRDVWLQSLEVVPWNRALLQALGTLSAFDGRPREGMALLRRALGVEMIDAPLMRTVAAGYLHLLQDERLARDLLTEAKAQVRARRIAQVCHGQLRGHVLWNYPKLVANVRGVIEVGASCGELVPAWRALEIGALCCLEPRPAAHRELTRVCQQHGAGQIETLPDAVGDHAHAATLRWGSDASRASLLRTHPLAGAAGPVQTHSCEVAVTTLDALVASGKIDPRRYDLLFIDTEGTELEVLRGARELLRHIEVISVRVFLHPVYGGAALPEQIQQFLATVFGKDGFGLRAFEPGADPAWGEAVFKRHEVRR